jgi:hypothetical protein
MPYLPFCARLPYGDFHSLLKCYTFWQIRQEEPMADRPICFVISPIGKDGTDVRSRSDQILKHVIAPVADECGYTAVRADQISEPGLITTQVINHIINDPMVVADLTGNNANVFYELAVRHAARKPFVQIIQKSERIPFDVAGVRTIELDHTNLDSVASAKDEIRKQMKFTAENPDKIESPISVAIDFERLKQSGDPKKRQLGDILRGIADLKGFVETRLTVIERRIKAERHWVIDAGKIPNWSDEKIQG